MKSVRLQKFMAACGAASRRHCEDYIVAGRVKVNGAVIRELGTVIDPDSDHVLLDGKPLHECRAKATYILNKPPGVITTARDERGRTTVLDLVDLPVRLFPVGRLDKDSEGLVILTNDGGLAQKLSHPRHHVPRIYEVTLKGKFLASLMPKLLKGVDIGDAKPARALNVEMLSVKGERIVLRIELGEGRKRQIRRMMDTLGYEVKRLVRTQFGPIRLSRLNSGTFRKLTGRELEALYNAVEQADENGPAIPRK